MSRSAPTVALIATLAAVGGCGLPSACGGGTEPDAETVPEASGEAGLDEWRTALDEWKAEREEGLRRPDGWLSLVGLFWLEEGVYSVGSDGASDLVFPPPAPARLGVLERRGREVLFRAEPGMAVTAEGETVSSLALVSDAAGDRTVLEHGSLSFYVIERGERVGVRLKDSASDLLTTFEGMETFPPDPAWRVSARFELYDQPRMIDVPNILGDTSAQAAPGVAVFEIDGREHRLEPTGDPAGPLFFVFGDRTNGRTTYGGGRFLYAGPPAADGSIVLDFNRAYNPPCVFTPYATCPLPRPEDKLALAVEAGEKKFGAAHP